MKSASSKEVAVNLYALGQRPLDVVERDLDATRQLQRIDGRLFLDSQDDGWPGVVRALASFDRGPFRTVPRLRTRTGTPSCAFTVVSAMLDRSANRPSPRTRYSCPSVTWAGAGVTIPAGQRILHVERRDLVGGQPRGVEHDFGIA